MPFEAEHACRLMYPGDFTEFRSKASGKARLIMGKRKGSDEWEVQAIRYPKENWAEATALASCQAHDGMFEAAVKVAEHTYGSNGIPEWNDMADGAMPEAAVKLFRELEAPARNYSQELRGVEIFSAGVWNGDPYTEGDLDKIVDAYPAMPRRPPLKMGHAEAQKFFGQPDGHPALGWVDKIYRQGTKLLADFVNVPETVVGMIRNRNYDRVSAEIYWNYKLADGKVLPRALKAVSLLGADWPAVSNLQDLQAALLGEADRVVKAYGQEDAEVKVYENNQGGSEMEKKEYEDKIAGLTSDLGKSQEDAKAAVARAEAAEKTALEAELRVFSLELDTLVRQGKILPAEVQGYQADFRAMGTTLRKYTEGGKEVEKPWGQKKLEELKSRPKLVEFKEQAQGGDGEGDGKKPETGESFAQETERVMAERKCSYSEAQEAVRIARPDLFAAYVTRKEGKK